MKRKIIYRKPLGNPTRNYRQDRFLISSARAWGAGWAEDETETRDIRRCIQLCKEMGFDMTEYIWADLEMTKECIKACEEYGIDGLFQNWKAFGGFQGSKGEMKINMEEFEKFVEFGNKYRHFKGYVVWDEPFSDETILAAAQQVNVVEELQPDKLPFTAAIPSYVPPFSWKDGSYESYLRDYAKFINPPVLALDHYPFSGSRPEGYNQLDDSDLFLDIALLRELSLEMETPMWFYIQTQDSPLGELYFRFTPERVKMQAYNVLLYGGKSVRLYNTVDGAMYNDGRKGPLYYPMKEMNEQIRQWGKTLMALTSEHVFHSPEVLAGNVNFDRYREPLSNSSVLADCELPFRCSVGEFADEEGNRYLFILNRDYLDSRTFQLKLQKPFRVYEVSGEDGMQKLRNRSVRSLLLKLAPGDAAFLRLQDAEEEAFLINYVLKK